MPAAEPLGLTVHSMPRPDLDAEARRTRAGRWRMFGVLLLCASPVIASYLTYFWIRPEGRTNYSTLIDPARPLPALALTDLDGQPVDAASLRGQWLLVVVGPSGCDAGCEKRLYLQRQMREMMGRDRDRIDKLWLVTDAAPLRAPLLDAVRAAPAVQVLRADAQAVREWLEPAAGEALESHLYIVDPMGRWMMRAPPEPDPGRLKRDIDKLLRASESWDRAGR